MNADPRTFVLSRARGSRGFTLVEMLVSLAIFAVVTSFATANFSAGRRGDELRFSSQLIASEIRRGQSSAAGGETALFCNGGARDGLSCLSGQDSECTGGTCEREVPHGYGIHFSATNPGNRRMLFFADANGNRQWDAGEEIRNDAVSPGMLVVVSGLSPNTGNALDIVFEPPKPTVYFNGAIAQSVASITVRHPTTNQTKVITVNRISGQVSAD